MTKNQSENLWKESTRIREALVAAYFKAVRREIYTMLANTFTNLERASTLAAMPHIIKATDQPTERIMTLFRDMYFRAGVAAAGFVLRNIKSAIPDIQTKENPFVDINPIRTANVDQTFFRQAMIKFADDVGAQHVTNISITNEKILNEIIVAATENGWSVPTTVKKMRTYFKGTLAGKRATMIARTEIMTASSHANNLTGQEITSKFNISLKKFWIPSPKGKYRPTHLAMAGKDPIPFKSMYNVGGNLWKHPHDPAMPPGEIINCRCTEAYIPL